ncbi:MAG: PHP domain-containing protein [Propionibacteriales bacterium]|nr:PHP domain-containing protein [Propionibacteriales bacterium]
MRIDLHAHSDRSDGTDPPGELVAKAARAGLDVVALTDHDTSIGWDEAAGVAGELGMGFVPGMEISCSDSGAAVHLLAYLPDPAYQPLAEELRTILDGRVRRLPATLDRLRELGIDITAEDVRRGSRPAEAMGRPHIADALIAKGVVANREEAFDRYLSIGRPAYVERYAADLTEMVRRVTESGGVPVLAHPWARHSRRILTRETIERLVDAGLAGLEVDHPDHDPGARAGLRDVVTELDLVMTGSGDYHGEGKQQFPLGGEVTAEAEFARLTARAASNAAASGRRTPVPMLP